MGIWTIASLKIDMLLSMAIFNMHNLEWKFQSKLDLRSGNRWLWAQSARHPNDYAWIWFAQSLSYAKRISLIFYDIMQRIILTIHIHKLCNLIPSAFINKQSLPGCNFTSVDYPNDRNHSFPFLCCYCVLAYHHPADCTGRINGNAMLSVRWLSDILLLCHCSTHDI